MSKILEEVLSANHAYTSSLGTKGDLALPPARRFAILTCTKTSPEPSLPSKSPAPAAASRR